MKKFISAVTSLAMAATMASSIAPSISAADATKTFSLKAYAEAGSKYDAMGDKVTISKEDIAAGDVTVPCAVYLDEATADSETISVQFTINSDKADVKNVTMKAYGPSDNYFSEKKTFDLGGTEVKTKKFIAFAGGIDAVLGSYTGAGGAQIGCDSSQAVAGAKNYFVGYSWTNGGESYTWTGSKSTEHPVMVFDVTFPKGTEPGDYKIEYCKYNTDTSGDHNNPSNMIETKSRYTEEAGNLKLNEMTITVDGEGGTTPTTESTAKPTETTTTQTTQKPTETTTVTTAKPDTNADVVFDFGSYKAKAGDKVNVNVMVDTKGQGVAAMDVVFKADSAIKITGIAKESPAFEKSVMTNMDILGANFTAIENGSGDPVKPEDGEAVFVIAVEVAADAKDGVYKIGFGDKCEVFKDATKNKFTTAAINGDITVGDPTPTTESTKVTESTETTKTTESTSKSTETTSKSTDTTTSSTSNLTPKYGDVNCDGEVNVADVVLLNKWLNNNADYAITEQGKVNADADLTDDKGITLADSEAILKSIVHLVELPVKK